MPSPEPTIGGGADVTVQIRDEVVLKAIRDAPVAFNQGFNRGLQRIGGAFGRRFTTTRLGSGGIRIRRSSSKKRAAPGQPALPPRMRAAGFKGSISGRKGLEGKILRVATSNPQLYGHEVGGPISGKNKLLRVRFSRGAGALLRGSWKQADIWQRQAEVIKAKGRTFLVIKGGKGKKKRLIPIATLKRSIRLRPRLGFIQAWDSFVPEAIERLGDSIASTLRRLGYSRAAADDGFDFTAGPSMGGDAGE